LLHPMLHDATNSLIATACAETATDADINSAAQSFFKRQCQTPTHCWWHGGPIALETRSRNTSFANYPRIEVLIAIDREFRYDNGRC
jgi:hypothetical protein